MSVGPEHQEGERIATLLHDQALQDLLVARQDLADAEESVAVTRARRSLDTALKGIRGVIRDLYRGQKNQRGGDRLTRCPAVSDDPDTRQDLVVSVSRELIRNAHRHSGADQVTCTVRYLAEATEVLVHDDGHGFDPAEAEAALETGHIGLASCRSRVERIGGRFSVTSNAHGTSVVAWIPTHGSDASG